MPSYVVDTVNGNDENDGLTVKTPFRTRRRAYEAYKDYKADRRSKSGRPDDDDATYIEPLFIHELV